MALEQDPQIPGSTRAREAFFAFLHGGLSIGLLASVAHWADAPFVFPSLGPTAFLLFYRPEATASCPRNTILGHLVGAVCGIGAILIFGLQGELDAITVGVTWARAGAAALSLGATAGVMIFFRVAHPPAGGATTLIVSLGIMTRPEQLATLVAAVALLVVQAMLTHRIARTEYPAWAPRRDPDREPR